MDHATICRYSTTTMLIYPCVVLCSGEKMRELPTNQNRSQNTNAKVLRNYTVRTTSEHLTGAFNGLLERMKETGVKVLSERGTWVKVSGKGLVDAILWQEHQNGTLPEFSPLPNVAMEQAFTFVLEQVAENGQEFYFENYFGENAPIGQ